MKIIIIALILLTLNYSEENEVVEYQEHYIAQDSVLDESNRDSTSVQQEQQDSSSHLDTTIIKGYYFLK